MDTDFLKDVIPYRCPKCGDSRKFSSLRDLKLHLNAEHAFKVGCVKPRTRTNIFDNKVHNSRKRNTNKENLSRQWSSSYDSRQSLTSSESYDQDLPVLQSYREDARMLEKQLESAREFERNKRMMQNFSRSHSYDPLNSTLDKLNKDVMNSRKNIWQSSDALYNAEDVINGVEIAAEERFNNQQNIIQNLVDSLQQKERQLATANENVEKLRYDKEKLMKEVEDLFKNTDMGNKKLIEELETKQHALNEVTKELAYIKQKTSEDLKQKDEKLQEAERCLRQLEFEQKNLEDERENLIEKVQMDSGLLRKTLEMKEIQVRKLNMELETMKIEHDKIISDSVDLYNTANHGTSKLKDLLKQRDTQLHEADVELSRMKELNDRLVWESRQLTEQADEHSQLLHQILRQKEEELAHIKQELQSVLQSDKPKLVNQQVEQLQQEVEEKTALLQQKESELQSLKNFLTTTAEKEAVAREKLEKFITELIDRADRAEKELDALKNHFLDQQQANIDLKKLKTDLETSIEDIDSDDEMSDDLEMSDVRTGSLQPTSPSPLKRQYPVVKSKHGYQGVRGITNQASSLPYSPSLCDSGYHDSRITSPGQSHISPSHHRICSRRLQEQGDQISPRTISDEANYEAVEGRWGTHSSEHQRHMSPDHSRHMSPGHSRHMSPEHSRNMPTDHPRHVSPDRYMQSPTGNTRMNFSHHNVGLQSPVEYSQNYSEHLQYDQEHIDAEEPRNLTHISEDEILYIPYNKPTTEPVEYSERQMMMEGSPSYPSPLPQNTFRCIPKHTLPVQRSQVQAADDTTQSYSISEYQGLPVKVQPRIRSHAPQNKLEDKPVEWSVSSTSRQSFPRRNQHEYLQSNSKEFDWSVSSSARQGFPVKGHTEQSISSSSRQVLPGRNHPEWSHSSSNRHNLPVRRQVLQKKINELPYSERNPGQSGDNSLSDVLSITDETMPSENNSSFQKIMDENGIVWETDIPQNNIRAQTMNRGNSSEDGILKKSYLPKNYASRSMLDSTRSLHTSADGILWDTDTSQSKDYKASSALPVKSYKLGASEPMLNQQNEDDYYSKYKSTNHLPGSYKNKESEGLASRGSTYSYPRLKMSEKFLQERKQFSDNLKKMLKLPFLRESGIQAELTHDTLRSKRGDEKNEISSGERNGEEITLNSEAPFRNYYSELSSEPSTKESSTQTWMIDRELLESESMNTGNSSKPGNSVCFRNSSSSGKALAENVASKHGSKNDSDNEILAISDLSAPLEGPPRKHPQKPTEDHSLEFDELTGSNDCPTSLRVNNEVANSNESCQNLPKNVQTKKSNNLNKSVTFDPLKKDQPINKNENNRDNVHDPVIQLKKRDLFEELRQESFNENPDLHVPVCEPEVQRSSRVQDNFWNQTKSKEKLGVVSPQKIAQDMNSTGNTAYPRNQYGSENDEASINISRSHSNNAAGGTQGTFSGTSTNGEDHGVLDPTSGPFGQQLNESVFNLIASTVKDAVSQITSAVKNSDSAAEALNQSKADNINPSSKERPVDSSIKGKESSTDEELRQKLPQKISTDFEVANCPTEEEVDSVIYDKSTESLSTSKPTHSNLMSDSDNDIAEDVFSPDESSSVQGRRKSLSRQLSVDVRRGPEVSLLDLDDEADGGTESLSRMNDEHLTPEPLAVHTDQSLSPSHHGNITDTSLSHDHSGMMVEEALTPESLDQTFFAQPDTEMDDESRNSISSFDGFTLSRSSSQDSILSERMSTYSKRETTRKRRQALCHIFSFLDTATLIQVALVCREWKKISRHPSLWKHVFLKNQKCSVEFLLNVSKWCTSMETLHLEGLTSRDKKEFESEEDYEKRTRAILEPGLEKLLQVSESTLKTATIIHCENIITDKGLWLVSCYSRVVKRVTYICNKDLPGADVIWALGAGCRDIKYLNITFTDPSAASGVKFNNKCLQVISQFCQDLQTLCIGGTEIDINGLVLIAKSCQRLSRLELHYSSMVTEDTMVAMCRLGLQHMKQIVFHFTPVEAKAILQLCKSSKHLRKIHISMDISNFDLKGEYKEDEKLKKYADTVKHLKDLEKKPGVGNILKLNCGEVFINTEKKFFGLF